MNAVPSTFLFVLMMYGSLASAQTLHYLGQQVIPHNHEFAGTTVGGLSGLDYDASSKRFVVISDDRSERQPARFYTLSLDLAEFNDRAEPGHAGVRFLGVTTLRDKAGKPHVEGSVDPEAIRFAGDGNFWWASEGNVKRGVSPAIEKVGGGGTALRRLDVPQHYLPGDERGVRHNLAFESLALADGKLYVSNSSLTASGSLERISCQISNRAALVLPDPVMPGRSR
jgi:hypothetical protein